MFYTIYQITHLTSGKIYIGKHKTENLRDGYMGSGKRLKYAIKKYGLSAFEKKILHVFDTETEMNAKERELVTEEFCKRKDTYNICEGGKGGWSYVNTSGQNLYGQNKENYLKAGALGREVARLKLKNDPQYREEWCKRSRESISKYFESHEHPWSGRQHKSESKNKISQYASTRTGSRNSMFGMCWITDGKNNRVIHRNDEIPDGWKLGRRLRKTS